MKIVTSIIAVLTAVFAFAQEPPQTNTVVTAVSGESWLDHLHRSFADTSMGKTWRLGPADLTTNQAAALPSTPSGRNDSRTQFRTLQGSDLYRLNCQGCHGKLGLGSPPEIGSLIDPVRAASAALVEERMKKIGMTMSRRQIEEMASQSKIALLKRLHQGGTDMPLFRYLSNSEIRLLIGYLQQLAGVPGADKNQGAIRESHARVGELIAKSTCHICHSATGVNPTSAEFLDGAIPPLNALTHRVNRPQLIRKVTAGAPIVGETITNRGRMPVFDHLSADEAADVFDYLAEYPPADSVQVYQTRPAMRAASDSPVDPRDLKAKGLPAPFQSKFAASIVLPVAAGVFVLTVLALGFCFTVYECKRISRDKQARTASESPVGGPIFLVASHPKIEMALTVPNPPPEALHREFGDWWEDEKVP